MLTRKQVENARKFIEALRTVTSWARRYLFNASFDGNIEEALQTLERALALASQKPRPYWQPTDTPTLPSPRPVSPSEPWRPKKPWKPTWSGNRP